MALRSADFPVLERHWGWFLALGISLLVLGLVALGMRFALTMLSVMYYGVLLLIGGGFELVHAWAARRWSGFLLQAALGILYVIAGGYLLSEPVEASLVLTLVLGISFLATGVARILLGLGMRGASNWSMIVVSGVVSLLLGAMIVVRWPASGLWVIGVLVAVELISSGCSWIALALTARTINSRWVPLTK